MNKHVTKTNVALLVAFLLLIIAFLFRTFAEQALASSTALYLADVRIVEHRDEYIQKSRAIETELQTQRKELVSVDERGEVIQLILRLLGENDISLIAINPLDVEQESVLLFPVEVHATGSFNSIHRFLYDLERSRYFVSDDMLALDQRQDGSVEMRLRVKVYMNE